MRLKYGWEKHRQIGNDYKIADFLFVQLSLSRFTLITLIIKSCLSKLHQHCTCSFINLIIRISELMLSKHHSLFDFFRLIFGRIFMAAISASQGFSADFRRTKFQRLIRLSVTAEGSTYELL